MAYSRTLDLSRFDEPVTPKEVRERFRTLVVAYDRKREAPVAVTPAPHAFAGLLATLFARYPVIGAPRLIEELRRVPAERLANALRYEPGDAGELALDEAGQLVLERDGRRLPLMRPSASGPRIVGFFR